MHHANENMPNKCVQLQPHVSGMLTIWIDTPNRSVNVLNAAMLEALEAAVQHVSASRERYTAVVFRSRKSNCFFVGADVVAISEIKSKEVAEAIIHRGQELMNRIAALPMPTIAAISGTCMGGGLELALACKYRIVSDSRHTQLGLPEIKLGLIPGWGGTQRLPMLVGLQESLSMILTGKSVDAAKAVRSGLADASIEADLWEHRLPHCCGRIAKGEPLMSAGRPRAIAKRVRNWFLERTPVGRNLVFSNVSRRIAVESKMYPALGEAIRAIRVAIRTRGKGFNEESRAFCDLLFTGAAQSLIGLFVRRDRARRSETWVTPPSGGLKSIERVAVIGAGAMGAGIGALAASKGFCVVFKEINATTAEAGRARVEELLRDNVKRGRMNASELGATMSRIVFTDQWEEIADCDLAIEAVLETEAVKRDVFQMLDRSLPSDSILASNTSSLCITRMPPAHRRAQTAGLHFFNPVHRMELVEIVRTESTSDRTLASLLEFVHVLGKTPIVTSDKPGFLVNRVLFPYLGEAVRMVGEGYEIQALDKAMRAFGMPMGPLELIDQVGVDIAAHVAESLAVIQPDAEAPSKLLATMVERGWLGKKSGLGFYVYDGGSDRQPNELIEQDHVAPRLGVDLQRDGMTHSQRRLVFPMLNESVHCLDELVVTESWMVDLGMVLGTGFAPMYGGPLQLIDRIGPSIVLHNMQRLAEVYGARFAPADGLTQVVRRKALFQSLPTRNVQSTLDVKENPVM